LFGLSQESMFSMLILKGIICGRSCQGFSVGGRLQCYSLPEEKGWGVSVNIYCVRIFRYHFRAGVDDYSFGWRFLHLV